MNFKKYMSKTGRSLTVNHVKRLYNTDTQKAVEIIKTGLNNEQVFKLACPFCSISNLVYNDRYWKCPTCDYTYPVKSSSHEAVRAFMDTHARKIYLSGKGVENSAYEQQGAFYESAEIYKKSISTNYLCSQAMLLVTAWSIYQSLMAIFAGKVLMTFVFILMLCVSTTYSLFFAFKGYTLATRQMYVESYKKPFHFWLDQVGLLYFLNIGKRKDIDLNDFIEKFEIYEKELEKEFEQMAKDDDHGDDELGTNDRNTGAGENI